MEPKELPQDAPSVGGAGGCVHGSRRWHEQCVGTGAGDQPAMSCSGLTACGVPFYHASVRRGAVELVHYLPRFVTCPACLEAMGR